MTKKAKSKDHPKTTAASASTNLDNCDAGFLHHSLEHAIVSELFENSQHLYTPSFI